MSERLLTIKEVAVYLGIPEKEVERLVARGKLPAYKIGGTFLRFKLAQVEAIKNTILSSSPKSKHASLKERLVDFLHFNDFYIISFLLIIGLIFIIIYF